MARDPVYRSRQLLNGIGTSGTGASNFAAAGAIGMRNLGEGISQLTKEFDEIPVEQSRQEAMARAKQADADLTARINRIMLDPDGVILNMRGKKALDGRGPANAAIRIAVEEIRESLPDDAGELYEPMALARFQTMARVLARHLTGETGRFDVEASIARIAATTDGMKASPVRRDLQDAGREFIALDPSGWANCQVNTVSLQHGHTLEQFSFLRKQLQPRIFYKARASRTSRTAAQIRDPDSGCGMSTWPRICGSSPLVRGENSARFQLNLNHSSK